VTTARGRRSSNGYAPLVYGICRRYELSGPGIDEVGVYVWLRLVTTEWLTP